MTKISHGPVKRAQRERFITREKLQQLPELLAWVTEAEESSKQRAKNQKYLSSNYKKWLALYPERYVVVIDGRLAGRDRDLRRLYQRLARRGFDTKNSASAFLTTKPRPTLILLKAS